MPRMGTPTASVTALATPLGTHSSTMEKTPAASSAFASATSFAAPSGVPPCILKPPKLEADCGVRPMWPMTGMPTSTMRRMVSAMAAPPSSLTQSQFVSMRMRQALRMACSGLS